METLVATLVALVDLLGTSIPISQYRFIKHPKIADEAEKQSACFFMMPCTLVRFAAVRGPARKPLPRANVAHPRVSGVHSLTGACHRRLPPEQTQRRQVVMVQGWSCDDDGRGRGCTMSTWLQSLPLEPRPTSLDEIHVMTRRSRSWAPCDAVLASWADRW
jgi:hypothetical protein